MREVLTELMAWWEAGSPVGVATVVAAVGSAPRMVGSTMLVGPDGSVVGSVSGGCVEAEVYELAVRVRDGGHARTATFGVGDDVGWQAGLTCGGTLEIHIDRIDPAAAPELGRLAASITAGRPVAWATVIEHPLTARVGRHLLVEADGTTHGSLGSRRAEGAVADDVRGLLASGLDGVLVYGPEGQRRGEGMRVLVHSFAAKPRLIVCGATDVAAALAQLGSFAGFHVTVCDARPLFATAARLPSADEVVCDWPQRYLRAEIEAGRVDARSAVAVLTHDPRFDVPVLEVALRAGLAYVGAMGSRRTHDDRMSRLRDQGLTEPELRHLRSPIGLDLGARTPQETALSILAELVADRWGGTGARLRETSGPMHSRGLHAVDLGGEHRLES